MSTDWMTSQVPVWVLIVASILGAGGGLTARDVLVQGGMGPDAKAANRELDQRVDRVQDKVATLKNRVVVLDLMPEQMSAMETRISMLQVDMAVLLKRTEYLEEAQSKGG